MSQETLGFQAKLIGFWQIEHEAEKVAGCTVQNQASF